MIVGIIGSFHASNFGDQLLFNILANWIKENNPEHRIVVPWGTDTIRWPEGVEIGGEWNALTKCQLVVFGGGGYLGEPPKPKPGKSNPHNFSLIDRVGNLLPGFFGGRFFGEGRHLRRTLLRFNQYRSISNCLKSQNIPYLILGTGAGPFNEGLGKRILKPVFKNASLICLRDDESKKFAQSITSAPITVSADIVLSETKDSFKRGPIETVGVHVGQVSNQEHLKKIVRRLKDIENRFKLVLVTDSDNIEQSNAANLFSKQITFSNKIQCTSIENFVAELDKLDAVVTTKLHVAIVCYTQGVLAISLPAHPKTQRFFSQAAMNEFQFDLSPDGIDEAFNFLSRLADTSEIYSDQIQRRREELRGIALQNKTLLEKFLC